MLKRSRLVYGAALAAMLGGGSAVFAQEAAPEADALFTKLDKNGDGKLTMEEIPEEQVRFFERLVRLGDKNKDGVLTKDEFQQANRPEEKPNVPLGPGGGGEGRGGDARQRFEMLDRNKDGKVTLDEIPEQIRERLKPAFDRLGKTELTADDFAKLPGPGGAGGPGGPRPAPGEMFKRLDANGDGKVTKDELPAEMRERMAPLFERLGKSEFTQEDFARVAERLRGGPEGQPGQNPEGRRPEGARPEGAGAAEGARRPDQGRPEGGRPAFGTPDEMFGRLDSNGDGKVTVEEAPERAKQIVTQALRRAGKDANGSLTKEEFLKNMPTPPRGPESQRRPEGDRGPEARRPDGERRPEGDRAPEGRRPEGEQRREGDRGPETRRPEGDRPQDGRRPEGDRRPEARGPEGRGPEGDRRPDRPRGPVLVRKLDRNNDGRISKDELAKLADLFDELDTNHDGHLDPAELIGGPMGPPRDGEGPRPGDRRPEGDRPLDRRVEGDRRPEGDRGPEGRRPEGDRRLEGDRGPDVRRPEGERRDPVRGERPRGDGEDRRPEREQPRGGEKPRDRE